MMQFQPILIARGGPHPQLASNAPEVLIYLSKAFGLCLNTYIAVYKYNKTYDARVFPYYQYPY